MEVSKIFEGKPCKVCGNTTRYNNKNKQCVACKKRLDAALHLQRKARKQVEQRHSLEVA